MMPETSGNEMRSRAADSGVRLAELMAALSIATDLGMGQPLESALCSCVVAMRLGEALNLDSDTLRDVFYQALLRYIGCNADANALAALMGDELALRHDFAAVDPGRPPAVLSLAMHYLRLANAGEPPYRMAALVARGLLTLPRVMNESFAGHCEVAQRLAGRLGLAESLIVCLGQLYERWDGKGRPRGLKGEEVAPAVLLVTLAQDAVIWTRIGGPDAAVATVRKRSGGAYHPGMAERFCKEAPTILAGLDQEPTWESVLALEPGGRDCLTDEEFDRSCEALADFADMKSPYTLGHSPGVAALAAGAGRRCGLIEADVTALRRAGLLHDIGRVGVSAGIWGKEGALSEREWEQVRLHAYYTDRVLARPEPLGRLGVLASQHHERMDGSGYHRAIPGPALSPAARILAAADAYHAMTEPRPHRGALSPEEAAEELRREVRAGRLDGDGVHAILAEAGHRHPGGTRRARRERPAGLSEREVEVLRLLARGLSNRDMAEQLYLSPDTVKHHIRHIYDKTGVSTRAGATLFAMENGLL
jgi:HD-GYP domain-containing protein (c-di-GMP phosphodiesterase class II)